MTKSRGGAGAKRSTCIARIWRRWARQKTPEKKNHFPKVESYEYLNDLKDLQRRRRGSIEHHFTGRTEAGAPVRSARERDLPHHGRSEERKREGSDIHMDYFSPRGTKGEQPIKCLAMIHLKSGALKAHVVPSKGTGHAIVVEQVVKSIKQVGEFGMPLLKSDQEFPIVDLLQVVAKRRGQETTIVESAAKGDSRGNGMAERGVQTAEEALRVGILDLGASVGVRVSVHDPIVPWILRHGVDMYNKCQVGAHGRTPYERLKLKKYSGTMFPFGEPIHHRVTGKVQGGDMRERWCNGTFL